MRGAAEMLKGFANVCPESGGELYHASELYYMLGDYDTAVKLSSSLINHQPDAQLPYFRTCQIRTRSEAIRCGRRGLRDSHSLIAQD